ncbi:MAG TPA: two-component regulator propeller domain-containing protein, partial [bacterium]|nr:two-component regulator propeller domain-containing protein [bacterium]
MTKYVWRSLLFFEIALISLICSVTAQVRFVDLDRLSLEEGLSQSSAICMLQDRQGFLWIGTEDGLNRYDGYSIKIFKADPADSGALQNAWITSLFEDHTGNLWVGTRGGLHRYDAAKNRFISIPLDNTSLSVFAITEDLQHHLWVGTQQAGLFRKSVSTADWRQYRFDPADPRSVSSNDIFVLYTDDIGRVWIGTRDNGLNRYDAMADNFIRYQPTP